MLQVENQPEFNANDAVLNELKRPDPLYDSSFQPFGTGWSFERLQMPDTILSLLIATREFRNRAISYRGFAVGAGALALSGSTVGRYLGFNVKLDESDLVNIHAEDIVTAKAEDAGFNRTAALAVIGPVQEDHSSGLVTPTLHCCGRCRGRLHENPIISDETLFVFARPDFTVIQFGSLEQVEKVHRKEKGAELQTFYYEETPEVFSPLPQPDADGILRPEQHEVDDTDWQETAGLFLMKRYVQKLGISSAG